MTSNDLIADVVQLPVRPGAAMRLLWMLDDTHASASDLGRLIESDHALSAQVLGPKRFRWQLEAFDAGHPDRVRTS